MERKTIRRVQQQQHWSSKATSSGGGSRTSSSRSQHNAPVGGLVALGKSSADSATDLSAQKKKGDSINLDKSVEYKIESSSTYSSGAANATSLTSVTDDQLWQKHAVELLPPHILIEKVAAAMENDKLNRSTRYLCSAAKHLEKCRTSLGKGDKVDVLLSSALSYCVKQFSLAFREAEVTEAFSSLLKQQNTTSCSLSVGPRRPAAAAGSLCSFVANLLYAAYSGNDDMPLVFVKVFLDDSLADRQWVDLSECGHFVRLILNGFDTVLPTGDVTMIGIDVATAGGTTSGLDSSSCFDLTENDGDLTMNGDEFKRECFSPGTKAEAAEYTLALLRDTVYKKGDNPPKCLLKTLSHTAGLKTVRDLALSKLDLWLQNAKLQRSAVQLLHALFLNVGVGTRQETVDSLGQLLKLKTLKNKSVVNVFGTIFEDFLRKQNDSIETVITLTVHNDLTVVAVNRMAHNGLIFQQCFAIDSAASSKAVGRIVVDLIVANLDMYRSIRSFLRELTRSYLKGDFPLVEIVKAIIHCASKLDGSLIFVGDKKGKFQERLIASFVDILCLLCFLASPTLGPGGKETYAARKEKFLTESAVVEELAVEWFLTSGFQVFQPRENQFFKGLKRLVFLDKPEVYSPCDGSWPTETDRVQLLKLTEEVPLREQLFLAILDALDKGLSPFLDINKAFDFFDSLIQKAACSLLTADKPFLTPVEGHFVDHLLSRCVYSPPAGTKFPDGYEVPKFVVVHHIWRVFIWLVVFAAHEPKQIGEKIWSTFPTCRLLIQMVMTGDFTFPQGLKEQEKLQVVSDSESIIEFETYLADKPITPESSLLLPLLISLDPTKTVREPPDECLKMLSDLTAKGNLAKLFSQCREPDFLLDMIVKQRADRSLEWVVRLIESEETPLELLPVQCLCEFLLHRLTLFKSRQLSTSSSNADVSQIEGGARLNDIINRLRVVLLSNDGDKDKENAFRQCLLYLLGRLAADTAVERDVAAEVLQQLILPQSSTNSADSERTCDLAAVFEALHCLPHFKSVADECAVAVRNACFVETDLDRLFCCAEFSLAKDQLEVGRREEAISLYSELLVKRRHLFERTIPCERVRRAKAAVVGRLTRFFGSNLEWLIAEAAKSRENEEEKGLVQWCDKQDLIRLKWKHGLFCQPSKEILLSVRSINAMVLLLCEPLPIEKSVLEMRRFILRRFFPDNPNEQPSAWLADTLEEAELYENWLRQRMLRSNERRLMEAATENLGVREVAMFLQSFGMPPDNVSYLLQRLDSREEDFKQHFGGAELEELCRFVLAHKKCPGVSGGDIFLSKYSTTSSKRDSWESMETQRSDVGIFGNILKRKAEKCEESQQKAKRTKSSLEGRKEANDRLIIEEGLTCIDFASFSALMNNVNSIRDPRRIARLSSNLLDFLMKDQQRKEWKVTKFPHRLAVILDWLSTTEETNISDQLRQYANLLLSKSAPPVDSIVRSAVCRVRERLLGDITEESLEMGEIGRDLTDVLAELQQKDQQEGKSKCLLEEYTRVDPELVSKEPEMELKLIFGKRETPGRMDIYSRLPHKVTTETLRDIGKRLLDKFDASLSPKLVLDFLSLCQRLPRLWLGRDRNQPRHAKQEDMLDLNLKEIRSLTRYCLVDDLGNFAEPRANLLLRCCSHDRTLFRGSVEELVVCLQNATEMSTISNVERFSAHVYIRKPRAFVAVLESLGHKYDSKWLMGRLVKRLGAASDSNCLEGNYAADVLVNRLVSDLFRQVRNSKSAGEMKIEEISLELRRLAVWHPLLILRQSSLIASLLKGEMNLTIAQYSQTNHRQVFSEILKLLKLLSPAVFMDRFADLFCSIVSSFMELNKRHVLRNRHMIDYLKDSFELCGSFLIANPIDAWQFCQRYRLLIQAACVRYPNVAQTYALATAIGVPMVGKSVAKLTADELEVVTGWCSVEDIRPMLIRPPTPIGQQSLRPKLQRLRSAASNADLLDALRELRDLCEQTPAYTPLLVHHVSSFASHSNESCRRLTFTIMVQHLRESPEDGVALSDELLRCLSCENRQVVATAVEFLPDFVAATSEGRRSQLLEAATTAVQMTSARHWTFLDKAFMLLEGGPAQQTLDS